MLDLYNVKYDLKTLKENIYDLQLIDILKTQILNVKFIAQYILSDLYQFTHDDRSITFDMVIQYQPHINKKELIVALFEYNSDDDSVENFQEYSERDEKNK
jgi:hypothetical protein